MFSNAIAMHGSRGVSKREKAARERLLCADLGFGPGGPTIAEMKGTPAPRPLAAQYREQAAKCREYARMGSRAQARKLIAEAEALELQALEKV